MTIAEIFATKDQPERRRVTSAGLSKTDMGILASNSARRCTQLEYIG